MQPCNDVLCVSRNSKSAHHQIQNIQAGILIWGAHTHLDFTDRVFVDQLLLAVPPDREETVAIRATLSKSALLQPPSNVG